jgi:DNA-directed RNA polymerase specialized sigma24 family protein
MAIAARYARSGARRLSLPQADRDDLEQDILLTLLERSGRFDATRGSWDAFVTLVSRRAVIDRMRAELSVARPAFVPVDLDLFPHGASATQQDHDDGSIALDLARVVDGLSEQPRRLLHLLATADDLSDAQKRAPQSRASFFRSLRDLRCWLRCAGLRPATRGRAARAPQTAETDSAPHP